MRERNEGEEGGRGMKERKEGGEEGEEGGREMKERSNILASSTDIHVYRP